MDKQSKIYIAGNTGLVGSAIVRKMKTEGFSNFVFTPFPEYDLRNQQQVTNFFGKEKPEFVIIAAAKVGGILANNTYRAQFIYENLMIQNNLIHQSFLGGVKKLLFLGSSCIYPGNCPQPIKEEYLLTGPLEYTNEPYAIAKIAGIKMCESYYRQYGCNFISVMPTNLYGPDDNYNLETSHVLPALIRKMHLAGCLEQNNWEAIRKDLDKRPINGVDGAGSEQTILEMLAKYGIKISYSPFAFRHSSLTNKDSEKRKAKSENRTAGVTVALWGTGQVFREFLHVDDMADACLFVIEKVDASTLYDGLKISQLNIGSGTDQTIYDLAHLVKKITGFNGDLEWNKEMPDGTYKKQLDISLLNKLGWKFSIPLEDGIRSVYDQYIK